MRQALHHLVGLAAAAVLLPAMAASAAAAVPLERAPSGSKLSGALATLAEPGVRSASRAERARRLGLPAGGPGSLVQRGADVVVNVRASTTGPGQVEALRSAGARVLDVAAELRTVAVAVAPAELRGLAAVPGVEHVSPELAPITSGLGDAAGPAAGCQGLVTSEADTQLRAAEARDAYGVTGAGVKVGVLSDSYDVETTDATNAADDVASGDLPGPGNPCARTEPVQVSADAASGTDEGRGMLQLVHDVAPGATLGFAAAGSSTAFPGRVRTLSESSDVVVDDIAWLDEPFFQPGPQSVAVAQARADGVAYFSSAGNLNVLASGQDRSSWEAPGWRPTTCPSALARAALQACMNFAGPAEPARNGLTLRVAPGMTAVVDLQWAEPWYGVDTDLDAFLLSGDTVVAASQIENPGSGGSQKPFELLGWKNTTSSPADVTLVIGRYSGPDPQRLKVALIRGGAAVVGSAAPQDHFGPTIFGHNAAPGGMSVAAVPFSDSQQVEWFSSRGPVTHYFGPVDGTTPAEPLAQPDVLAKPDIAATDGAATTFFGSPVDDGFRFYGTSAAAPHAAAVAALALEGAPEASLDQLYAALRDTAEPIGAYPPEAQGAGLVDAYAAVELLTRGTAIATTGDVDTVTTTSATLTGVASMRGVDSVAYFRFGTGSINEQATPQLSLSASRADVPVSWTVNGLEPNTTYRYALVTSSSAGSRTGAVRTFTTAALPQDPTPTPDPEPTPASTPAAAPPAIAGGAAPVAGPSVQLRLQGRKLRIAASAPAVVTVRDGRRVLKRAQVGTGATTLRLTPRVARIARLVTVEIGSDRIRLGLRPKQLRLDVRGAFDRASVTVRRGSRTLATRSTDDPQAPLALRLRQPRRPGSDAVIVGVG